MDRASRRPASSLEDAELARRIERGPVDEARMAEAELYRRFAPRVRLYGRRHLRDEQAAADLAHQVLLVTIERLRAGEVREPERLASFVLGMSRNVVIESFRSGARRERLRESYAADLAIADAAPEPVLDSERLKDCLEKLTERVRAVLVSSFYDEQPAEAVAAELGLTAANVRVIRHRGIEKLRDCMNEARP